MKKPPQSGLILTKPKVSEKIKLANTNKSRPKSFVRNLFMAGIKGTSLEKNPGLLRVMAVLFSPESRRKPFNAQAGSAHTAPTHHGGTTH